MGEGMSKKRTSGSGQEAAHMSAEELARSRVRPSTEKPTPAPILSTWGNMSPASVSKRSPSAYVDASEPTNILPGWKESQMDLPFEDCMEVLIAGCSDQEDQSSFHSRTDCDAIYMMDLAQSSEKVIHQGLKEFFGFLKILANVPILFLLELVNFLGRSIFQVLLVGLLTAVGDQMLEPLLAALFNSILQPLMVFLLNVLCTIRNLSYPIIDVLKGICSQTAVVLRAFRLVEINYHPKSAMTDHV
ncbi:hypothetical protein JD844_029054 [Phrynosoma platyrhinos]|uniref:Uncharacterized protein n=1 Tax=Phrynosoma platyrhinos TaxID=52577 RepID=A0ABQ7SIU5_PHRPL|nr:hypothetical protein JD844_029054 [Phrynosoma platyrhinos]